LKTRYFAYDRFAEPWANPRYRPKAVVGIYKMRLAKQESANRFQGEIAAARL
jgi:hypothetical protein